LTSRHIKALLNGEEFAAEKRHVTHNSDMKDAATLPVLQ